MKINISLIVFTIDTLISSTIIDAGKSNRDSLRITTLPDVHFNENGSQKVAEVIANCINRYLLKND
jgi:hypothetical protein